MIRTLINPFRTPLLAPEPSTPTGSPQPTQQPTQQPTPPPAQEPPTPKPTPEPAPQPSLTDPITHPTPTQEPPSPEKKGDTSPQEQPQKNPEPSPPPLTPDNYTLDPQLNLPDTLAQTLITSAITHNIPPENLSNFVKDLSNYYKTTEEQQIAEIQAHHTAQLDQLKADWGSNFNAKCTAASKAYQTLCQQAGLDPQKTADELGINYSPTLFRLFQHIAEAQGEGKIINPPTQQQLQQQTEANRIESDPTHPLHTAYININHPDHTYANNQYNTLMGIK